MKEVKENGWIFVILLDMVLIELSREKTKKIILKLKPNLSKINKTIELKMLGLKN